MLEPDGRGLSNQPYIDRPLLWLGCRRHSAEVILTHVFTALEIEDPKSPDVTLFTRFRNVFPSLSRTPRSLNFTFTKAPFLITKEFDLLMRLKELRSADFARDDYLEFLELFREESPIFQRVRVSYLWSFT